VTNATASCASGACGFTCAAGFADCDALPANGCEADLSSTGHCGGCGRVCPSGEACAAGACFCPPGRRLVAGACVADTAPRPVAPLSLGDVTQRRPTLRWVLAPGYDGAVVELCRDRACTTPLETLTVSGSSARPTNDLPARSVVFWRLRGRMGSATDAHSGPTWLFHVPAVSAPGGIDTSSNPHVDVNGDGLDDVVVGAEHASPGGRSHAGLASVFLGSATWSPVGTARVADRILEGVAPSDGFGASVAGAGDVNGDGYADLVVGAPYADPGGRDRAGTTSVFLGSATWTPTPAGTPRAPDRLLAGTVRFGYFGTSVAGAGDVNGDGYADVVVGANAADTGWLAGTGTASVFHGSATWTPSPPGTARVPDRSFEGAAAGDYFGQSVAGVGDVNSDGYADLVVGAPGADPGGRLNAGTASVFLGSLTWTPSPAGAARAPDRLLEGAAAGDFLGLSVSGAGDVNGDGYADLVVGAPLADPGGRRDAGTASVFLGSPSWTPSPTGTARAPDRVLEGVAPDDAFGVSVAGAGDVNADGYADLIVGARRASPGGRNFAGTASMFYGSATWVPGLEGTAPAPDHLLEGTAEDDGFGHAVAGAGDVNGDGFSDLVVGAPHNTVIGRTYAGTASVFHGNATWTPSPPGTARVPDRLFDGTALNDRFGWSVASAGGVNGDGCMDARPPGVGPVGRVAESISSVCYRSAAWIPSRLCAASSGTLLLRCRLALEQPRVGGALAPERGWCERHEADASIRSQGEAARALPLEIGAVGHDAPRRSSPSASTPRAARDPRRLRSTDAVHSSMEPRRPAHFPWPT
jgi:hypothetical protein